MKNHEDVKHIKEYGNNPRYLSNIQINQRKVKVTSNLLKALYEASIAVLAVPSAFVSNVLNELPAHAFDNKMIVSAIKGMITGDNMLITEYVAKRFNIPLASLCIIAGPCHSEEIALEKKSYLTIAGTNIDSATHVASLLNCRFVKTTCSTDLHGVEYAAIMKNIIAIACGLARGLNYGDNFQAVLVSNAMNEMKKLLTTLHPDTARNMIASAYLGDLLVTAYSPYSRNRTLGYLVGKGYSVKAAQAEMNMIAEGYYAVACIHELNKKYNIEMPIVKAIYNVLYEKISPAIEIRILENQMI
jgi:glycerol-3-phosphate dehydrogenase (NAD(P)+)